LRRRFGWPALALVLLGTIAGVGLWSIGRDGGALPAVASNAPERIAAPGLSVGDWRRASADSLGRPFEDDDVLLRARGPLPGSLAGSEIDGGLRVDPDGHFVPDPDALALFDYFLSASGEEDDAVIRQRIVDEITRRLDPPADSEAIALLDRVLGFREAMRELAESGVAPPDLERRLQWIRELRRAHFGADSEALFAEEETIARIDLERRRVWRDPALDEVERAARLAALDGQLPPRVRAARERARAPTRVREAVAQLESTGADADQIFAVREAAFGPEAASRLAALDAERAIWRARVEAYRAERADLLAELGIEAMRIGQEAALPESGRERLEALRAAHFDELEQRRVRALDGVD